MRRSSRLLPMMPFSDCASAYSIGLGGLFGAATRRCGLFWFRRGDQLAL